VGKELQLEVEQTKLQEGNFLLVFKKPEDWMTLLSSTPLYFRIEMILVIH
jgi:hypothetical protein